MSNHLRAERHPKARYTWAIVREIRARRLGGATIRELCRLYGGDPHTIFDIVHYRTWWPDPQEAAS